MKRTATIDRYGDDALAQQFCAEHRIVQCAI